MISCLFSRSEDEIPNTVNFNVTEVNNDSAKKDKGQSFKTFQISEQIYKVFLKFDIH